MSTSDIERALTPVVDALSALQIRYQIGGSVATSAYGLARSTLDIDIVVDMPPGKIDSFVRALENRYYVDGAMIRQAVARRESFNVIHLETMIKVDVFVLTKRLFSRQAFERGIVNTLEGSGSRTFVFASPEDMVVQKLEWFRLGGEVSGQQWNDILGVLRVQGEALDYDHIKRWAAVLDVDDLLQKALAEAG